MKTIFTCHAFLLLFLFSLTVMGQEVLSESESDSVSSTPLISEVNTETSNESIQTSSDTSKDIYSGRSSYTSNDLRNGQEMNYAPSKAVVTRPEVKKSLLSSSDKLMTGYTYNRYGELATPKGYGIQVVAFCNFKNLQKYLRLFVDKELYIQVIDYTNHSTPLYRVIIGANEDKELIEKEISLYNNAGVSAVLRKHSTANYEVYNYTNTNH